MDGRDALFLAGTMSCEVLPPPVSNKTTRFPYSLEFVVEDKNELLRDAAKIYHTQDLFCVTCFVQPHQTRREWVTVCVGSSTSQRNVEKAKVWAREGGSVVSGVEYLPRLLRFGLRARLPRG